MEQLITNSYEHKLACAYHKIDKRGMLIDTNKLAVFRGNINNEINSICRNLSGLWGLPVYVGRETQGDYDKKVALNLNAPKDLLETLKTLGYNVPKVRSKNKNTNEYEAKESTCDIALQKLYANNQLWPRADYGDGIGGIIRVRELVTIRNRYANARLYHGVYFSSYGVAATNTGRRSSKKSIFGFGGNSQNIPKHSELGEGFRECIVARPGRIFLFVDQKSAEDWIVAGLCNNAKAIQELEGSVSRHKILASFLFNKPVSMIFKDGMDYFLAKKSRYAKYYGMQYGRFGEALAAEGRHVPPETCKFLLQRVSEADPTIEGVFHVYIREKIFSERKLVTPFGRERQFFGLRNGDKNYNIFNEAFAFVPQSTIGDNTGLAVLHLDGCNDYVVQEGHDSIVQELPDTECSLRDCYRDTTGSFDRTISFHNGVTIKVPIEGELGYDWLHTVKIKEWTEDGVIAAWRELHNASKDGVMEEAQKAHTS